MENLNYYLLQTLEVSQDAILVADHKGVIQYWNSGAERILGFTARDAIGQSMDIFIPEKLRARHWEGYYRVMESGETKYKTGLLSSPGLTKDGGQVSLEFSMVLLRDEQGNLQGCASIMRDVTERWLKEKELKKRLAECEQKNN
jgi:PAS domain S-box-containing protein